MANGHASQSLGGWIRGRSHSGSPCWTAREEPVVSGERQGAGRLRGGPFCLRLIEHARIQWFSDSRDRYDRTRRDRRPVRAALGSIRRHRRVSAWRKNKEIDHAAVLREIGIGGAILWFFIGFWLAMLAVWWIGRILYLIIDNLMISIDHNDWSAMLRNLGWVTVAIVAPDTR